MHDPRSSDDSRPGRQKACLTQSRRGRGELRERRGGWSAGRRLGCSLAEPVSDRVPIATLVAAGFGGPIGCILADVSRAGAQRAPALRTAPCSRPVRFSQPGAANACARIAGRIRHDRDSGSGGQGRTWMFRIRPGPEDPRFDRVGRWTVEPSLPSRSNVGSAHQVMHPRMAQDAQMSVDRPGVGSAMGTSTGHGRSAGEECQFAGSGIIDRAKSCRARPSNGVRGGRDMCVWGRDRHAWETVESTGRHFAVTSRV